MSISKNMPARFKSRTHLKHVAEQKEVCRRSQLSYLLRKAHLEVDYAMITVHTHRGGVARSRAKSYLIDARRYRKSVVLPRLP